MAGRSGGAATEGFVDGDDGDVHVAFALCDLIFRLELGAFRVEQLEKVDHAFLVAHTSDVGVTLAFLRFGIELNEALLLGAVVGEGILGFLESAKDGVVVGGKRFIGGAASAAYW